MMRNNILTNPYVIGNPLTGPSGFFGRQESFDFVENILEAEQQNVALFFGQRRIGKTSLLHQIVHKFKKKDRVVPVYFDLQGRETKKLGEVLYALARKVTRVLNINSIEKHKFDESGHYFQEFFLSLVFKHLRNRRLLLLFDEFDVLNDQLIGSETAAETLFPYLQDLILNQHQIIFFFVVGRRLEELAMHFHPIFKQAAAHRIGLLTEACARDLITKPAKNVLKFEESGIQAVFELTSGHPYITQLVCFEIYNQMKQKKSNIITKTDVQKIVDKTIEIGHAALNWFWDGLPRPERFIMSAIAHVTDGTSLATPENIRHILQKHRIVLLGQELKDAPDRLVDWQMLSYNAHTDSYGFVVEFVRRWILKNHPLHSARRDIDLISKRATRLYNNARDAHSEGDLSYARDEYQRALDANPNHSGALLGLAIVLYELGEIEASIKAFEKAYAIDEINSRDGLVRARNKMGRILEENGLSNEAIYQYEKAMEIAPDDEDTSRLLADIWRQRGDVALSKRNLDSSAEHYQKALNYDKGKPIIRLIQNKLTEHIEHAKAESDYDQAKQAIVQLKSLIQDDQAVKDLEISFWVHRGETLAQDHKKLEKAIKAFEQAQELSPNDQKIAQKLQQMKAEWERRLEADGLFQKAFAAHRDQEWSMAMPIWLKMLKKDFQQYFKHNLAAFLAEAYDQKARNPSLSMELIPPADVIVNRSVAWKIIMHNDGDEELKKITVIHGTKPPINRPVDLLEGSNHHIDFNVTYNQTGRIIEKVTATAVTGSGRLIKCIANTTIEIRE
jgi:tetratricopeptide (TPR) repeat protein/GTPase SAR1 family protein